MIRPHKFALDPENPRPLLIPIELGTRLPKELGTRLYSELGTELPKELGTRLPKKKNSAWDPQKNSAWSVTPPPAGLVRDRGRRGVSAAHESPHVEAWQGLGERHEPGT
jgi:hypothetical protein